MFNIESYRKAGSVAEAVRLLRENPLARLIAGGTDVLVKLRKNQEGFHHLVDIHDIAELKCITRTADGDLVIGAGSCFTAVAESPLIRRYVPVLAQAVRTIGGPQVRNMATIGGNLCNGVPSADSAPPLLALNAVLTIEGGAGPRQMPLEDFFQGPGRVALEQHEVLTAISVARDNYAGYYGHYDKYAMRAAMDIATIGCAAVCRLEDGRLQDLRLAFATAAPVPIRCKATEDRVRGRRISPELLDDIARAVTKDLQPRTSWRATKEFRLQIIATLAHRGVRQAILEAGGSIA
ncbi:MAG: xanthine dehydrogenase FAD-binding subunit XdhB [Desulfobacterales bacterium]|nr:MAG: xanthine dehydrogenase FAD-binding subunit XdhB [Desulfobacterales bacterium]